MSFVKEIVSSPKTVTNIPSGQERLYSEYKIVKTNDKITIAIGFDGGSTSSRCSIADKTIFADPKLKSLEKVYTIPSSHVEFLPEDKRVIRPQSERIIDLLDSTIVSPSESEFIDNARILRATKMNDSKGEVSKIFSSQQKISTKGFYYNLIDSICYGIVLKYSNKLPRQVDAYLCASLRPDDLEDETQRQLFIKRLIGSYIWRNDELDVTLELNIKGVETTTESEAQIKGHYTHSKSQIPYCVMLIEGGGSSLGVSIIKDGALLKFCEKTFSYGGTKLCSILDSEYRKKHGGSPLSQENLEHMLNTGVRKMGKTTINAVDPVKAAKDSLAHSIIKDIKEKIIDVQDAVRLEDVETVLFGGGLFRSGDFESDGYSLAIPCAKELKSVNPGLEFTTIARNQIPYYNLLTALKVFGGHL